MTTETRTIFTLDEITALRWECTKCHSALSLDLNHVPRFPAECPSCHELMVDRTGGDRHSQAIDAFAESLRDLLNIQRQTKGRGVLKLEVIRQDR